MNVDQDIIYDLIKGQSRIEQAVKDIDKRLDIALPVIFKNHDELEDRIRHVESKQWYFGGAGTVLGGLITYVGEHLKSFGGK